MDNDKLLNPVYEDGYVPKVVITSIKKQGSTYNINSGELFISQISEAYKREIDYFLNNGGVIEEEQTDDEVLAHIKATKPAVIDAQRDTEIESGVEFKGKKFQSRKDDRDLLTSTVVLYSAVGQVPEGFVWIAEDNTMVPMTLQDLVMLGGLMGQKVNDCTIKARMLKTALENATTLEEAKQVSWHPIEEDRMGM